MLLILTMTEVIDNFLCDYDFKSFTHILMGNNFPWYYNDDICYENDGKFQFTHTFYNHNDGTKSYYYSLLDACQNKLGVKKLVRIKANLNPRTLFHKKAGYHIDFKDIMTAVYYVNTNNGWTKFKKGGRVKSVANRVVIFDSNLEHSGVTCTDEKRRMVINFNYEV